MLKSSWKQRVPVRTSTLAVPAGLLGAALSHRQSSIGAGCGLMPSAVTGCSARAIRN